MSNPNKYSVNLSEAERERLKQISRNGQAPAKKILHLSGDLGGSKTFCYQEEDFSNNL